MKKVIDKILKHKGVILTLFLVALGICFYTESQVRVNYNMMDYLPDQAESTKSLKVMGEEYATKVSNARVMLDTDNLALILEYKSQIEKVNGVTKVQFLDDLVSPTIPIEMVDQKTKEAWIKDGKSILLVTIEEDEQTEAVEEVRKLIDGKGIMDGSVVESVLAEEVTSNEISKIMLFVIPLIFVILIISTSSWFEPVLFLVTIGIAIVLNMGTNIIFGEISFVTQAAASILQLAVSMDYSIFLLHRFREYREEGNGVEEAMKKAVTSSFRSIMSSGLTTVVGFAALMIMQFKLGMDMGLVMAKGIFFSLLCVVVLLPILATYSYRLIDQTHHRTLLPKFDWLGKLSLKVTNFFIIVFFLLVVPGYLASVHNTFTYGTSGMFEGGQSQVAVEKAAIEEVFGKSSQMVLMVPKGDLAKEAILIQDLEKNPKVKSILSYVTMVDQTIPLEYVPQDKIEDLVSEHYSRMILTVDTDIEGKEAFDFVKEVRKTASNYYDDYELAGQSVNTYDMKDTVTVDNVRVNIVAIGAIFLILVVTFRSVSLSIILLFVIEASIWFNLSFTYFNNETLNYIAYLIISSIQLGATIDYAILFTNRYLENRREMKAKKATVRTISDTFASILTSSSILMIAGFMLGHESTNRVISQLGYLIGKGAFISTILVIFVLPGIFILCDHLIEKTTRNSKFYQEKGKEKKMKKKIKSISVFLLVSCLLLTTGIPSVSAREEREENIYIRLNSNGSVKEGYMVNHYQLLQEQKLCTENNDREIKNLTTSSPFKKEDHMWCIDAPKGNFYYQENLGVVEIPWEIEIHYYLDGKEVKGEELVGKNGHLVMDFTIRRNSEVRDEFFRNYLVQATMTLESDKAHNIISKGATIANVGSDKQLSFTVLAGSEKAYQIEADIIDFEMDGISINALPMVMDVELPDISDLTSKISNLENGITSLNDGTTQIYEGSKELKDSVVKLKEGTDEVAEGLRLLDQKFGTITSSSKELKDAILKIQTSLNDLDRLVNGVSDLNEATDAILTSLRTIDGGLKQITDDENIPLGDGSVADFMKDLEIKLMDPEYQKANPELATLYQVYQSKMTKVQELETTMILLISSYEEYQTSFTTLTSSLSGLVDLEEGIQKFGESYQEFDTGLNLYHTVYQKLLDGYTSIQDGVTKLVGGSNDLYDGTEILQQGSYTLKNSTTGMNGEVTSTIDRVLDSFDHSNYEATSFVDEEKVNSVQFIIQTDALKKTETKKKTVETTNSSSLWEKFIKLFQF